MPYQSDLGGIYYFVFERAFAWATFHTMHLYQLEMQALQHF
jgi:hypothetical protein